MCLNCRLQAIKNFTLHFLFLRHSELHKKCLLTRLHITFHSLTDWKVEYNSTIHPAYITASRQFVGKGAETHPQGVKCEHINSFNTDVCWPHWYYFNTANNFFCNKCGKLGVNWSDWFRSFDGSLHLTETYAFCGRHMNLHTSKLSAIRWAMFEW